MFPVLFHGNFVLFHKIYLLVSFLNPRRQNVVSYLAYNMSTNIDTCGYRMSISALYKTPYCYG